jgi:hypothetical protein
VVYPNATFFGEAPLDTCGKTFMDCFPSRGVTNFESILLERCYVFGGVTARREQLVRAGLLDETLRTCEDFDMWLRLCCAGAQFAYHHRPLVRYRMRKTSLSHNRAVLAADRLQVLQKLAEIPGLSTSERKALDTALQRQQARIDFRLGRIALYSRNRDEALERLARCNRVMRRPKLALAVLALRYAPAVLYRYVASRYPTQQSFVR